MHTVISLLVQAKTGEEALANGRAALDSLIERHQYDFYTTFDDSEGEARYKNIPAVLEADSFNGLKWIEEKWGWFLERQEEALARIHRILSIFSDSEIIARKTSRDHKLEENQGRKWNEAQAEENFLLSIKFPCACNTIGDPGAGDIWIYDNEGFEIERREHLDQVLDMFGDKKTKEAEGIKVWIVPADVHY